MTTLCTLSRTLAHLPLLGTSLLGVALFLPSCGGEALTPDETTAPAVRAGKDDSTRTPPQRVSGDVVLDDADSRGFRVLVKNGEGREVYCRSSWIRAYTTTQDGCPGETGIERTIQLGELTLPPGGTYPLTDPQPGRSVLATFEEEHVLLTGRRDALRYCYASTFTADCGFGCTDREGRARRYGEAWTQAGARHEIVDYRCEADGSVQNGVRCEAGYYLGTGGCTELGCGEVTHGGETSRPADHGRWVGTCDRGSATGERLVCDRGFVERPGQVCAPWLSCGSHPHDSRWHECELGRFTVYECRDGRGGVVSSHRDDACDPPRSGTRRN